MDKTISKRAGSGNEVLKKYIKTVWRANKGFFENLFSILTYASPFLGVGWLPLIATMFASHVLNIGLSDFGKWLDGKIGTGPGRTPTFSDIGRIEPLLESALASSKVTASHNISRRMVKNAGILSAIFRSGKVVKLMVKGISKLIGLLAGVFSVAHIDDLLKEITAPVREQVGKYKQPGIDYEEESKDEILPAVETSREKKFETALEQLEQKYR